MLPPASWSDQISKFYVFLESAKASAGQKGEKSIKKAPQKQRRSDTIEARLFQSRKKCPGDHRVILGC